MGNIIFAFLFVFGFAHADQKLTPLRKLKKAEQAALADIARATFHYRLQPGLDCTGTFISNKGHFLTALHCVSPCLARHRALQRSPASDDPIRTTSNGRQIFTHLMTVNEDRLDEGIECPANLGGREVIAKVVLTGGKGWLTPKNTVAAFAKRFPDDYKRHLDSGYEHGYDFAILHIEPSLGFPGAGGNSPCLPLAESAPRVGERLRAVSYACLNRDDLTSDGKTPLFTSGVRTKGFRESRFFKKLGSRAFKPELVERKETFFSSLDLEKCGSGSAILDKESKIVGIATRVYKTSTNYEYGSLEAIDIAQAWRELSSKASGSQIKEMTTCPRPRRVSRR